MKTLKQHGKNIITYNQKGNTFIRKSCPCGRTHLLMKQEGNRYIQCKCERMIEL